MISAYTTTEISGDCDQVTAVDFYHEATLSQSDPDYDYPYGLHGFTVDCTAPGGAVDVTYYWDKEYDVSDWTYRKFNPNNNQYMDFSSQVTYGTATVGGNTVTTVSYSVTDGGPYDGDGLVNGSILDPVGPTVLGAPDTGFEQITDTKPLLLMLVGAGILAGTGVHYGYRTRRSAANSAK